MPSDHFEGDVLYVRIGALKTRFRISKGQHVRVDQPGLAYWIAWALGSVLMWQRIGMAAWGPSDGGTNCCSSKCSKRCSSYLLRCDPEPPTCSACSRRSFLSQWRGRWRSFRMLEIARPKFGSGLTLRRGQAVGCLKGPNPPPRKGLDGESLLFYFCFDPKKSKRPGS